jgi:hypothetical protein
LAIGLVSLWIVGHTACFMAACRLIPKTDEAAFPYDEAMRLLLFEDSSMMLRPKDFGPLIASGREHCHWSADTIREHEQMAERGRCFDFRSEHPPYLEGVLYEDNIYFSFHSFDHQKTCLPVIESLRQKLDVRILKY